MGWHAVAAHAHLLRLRQAPPAGAAVDHVGVWETLRPVELPRLQHPDRDVYDHVGAAVDLHRDQRVPVLRGDGGKWIRRALVLVRAVVAAEKRRHQRGLAAAFGRDSAEWARGLVPCAGPKVALYMGRNEGVVRAGRKYRPAWISQVPPRPGVAARVVLRQKCRDERMLWRGNNGVERLAYVHRAWRLPLPFSVADVSKGRCHQYVAPAAGDGRNRTARRVRRIAGVVGHDEGLRIFENVALYAPRDAPHRGVCEWTNRRAHLPPGPPVRPCPLLRLLPRREDRQPRLRAEERRVGTR